MELFNVEDTGQRNSLTTSGWVNATWSLSFHLLTMFFWVDSVGIIVTIQTFVTSCRQIANSFSQRVPPECFEPLRRAHGTEF